MTQWYFQSSDSTRVGPLTDEEFHQRLTEGTVGEETRVWRSGLVDWTTYGAVREHEEQPKAAQSQPIPASSEAAAERNEAVKFVTCSGCREEWPENLLKSAEKGPICGKCVLAEEKRAWSRNLSQDGPGSGWLWRHIAICALIGILIAGLRITIGMFTRDGRKAMRQSSELQDLKRQR